MARAPAWQSPIPWPKPIPRRSTWPPSLVELKSLLGTVLHPSRRAARNRDASSELRRDAASSERCGLSSERDGRGSTCNRLSSKGSCWTEVRPAPAFGYDRCNCGCTWQGTGESYRRAPFPELRQLLGGLKCLASEARAGIGNASCRKNRTRGDVRVRR